jgi:hypothetical protein
MMNLSELPYNIACVVERVGHAVRNTPYELVAGIKAGEPVRVLARYPESKPAFLEVEVGGHSVVTIPLPIAAQVSLQCTSC